MRTTPKTTAAAALAGAALVLACAACSPGAPASQTSPTASAQAPSPGWTASLSGGDHAQAPGAVPPPGSWDPAAEQAAEDAAGKAMGFFARPQVDQRTWITDLAPLLDPAYRTEAEYIDPARVPVRKILGPPVLEASAGDPLTAKAVFATDAGKWAVLLHRAGPGQPWLVAAIDSQSD